MQEAMFYEKKENKIVRCFLCSHNCVIQESKKGICRVRINRNGALYTLVYGKLISEAIDPIEKKPLFHFNPGSLTYSIATAGCNFNCMNCQNFEISQLPKKTENILGEFVKPEKVISSAKKYDSLSIAYTYTEPIVWFEYWRDAAAAGHEKGLKSVMISAGYINSEPLAGLVRELDAIKIDLKAYDEEFYREICSAGLQPVLETLIQIRKAGTWLEIVNLIIPTLNDDEKHIDELCKWVVENLGTDVPIHFTRFYPTYKLRNLPPTPLGSVEKAREIAVARGIKFPYVGNVPSGHPGESTYCPGCGRTVVERAGYTVLSIDIKDGKCSSCGAPIPGIWA